MNFEQIPEFEKDLKRLKKKWRSLPSDIADAKLTIGNVYGSDDLFAQKFFNGKRATKLIVTEKHEVVKMRLDVESIGRNDKVRVVFIMVKKDNKIRFIELYAKNEKDREDQERIKKYMT